MLTATKQTLDGLHLRWAIRRDMPEILGIEAANFPYPWSEDDFIHCLRNRNVIGMVAEHRERVVGFMVYELHKNRLHILNFAVHAAMQRRGVGTAMIRKLHGKLAPQRRRMVMLECRETNLGAHLFFKAMGFRAIAIIPEFYLDDTPDESAYLFRLECGEFTRA